MAHYTKLDVSTIQRLCAAFGLVVHHAESLDGGMANSSYLTRGPQGLHVLTVLDNHDPDSARNLGNLLRHLNGEGVSTPAPLITSDGAIIAVHERRPVMVRPYVAGRCHKVLPGRLLPAVGAALAVVHGMPVDGVPAVPFQGRRLPVEARLHWGPSATAASPPGCRPRGRRSTPPGGEAPRLSLCTATCSLTTSWSLVRNWSSLTGRLPPWTIPSSIWVCALSGSATSKDDSAPIAHGSSSAATGQPLGGRSMVPATCIEPPSTPQWSSHITDMCGTTSRIPTRLISISTVKCHHSSSKCARSGCPPFPSDGRRGPDASDCERQLLGHVGDVHHLPEHLGLRHIGEPNIVPVVTMKGDDQCGMLYRSG